MSVDRLEAVTGQQSRYPLPLLRQERYPQEVEEKKTDGALARRRLVRVTERLKSRERKRGNRNAL